MKFTRRSKGSSGSTARLIEHWRSDCVYASPMWRLIVPVVLLASCSQPSASQKAEEDYQFISEHGASPQDLCDAKRAIADAYRKERNAEKYDLAKLTADISCRRAAQIAAGY